MMTSTAASPRVASAEADTRAGSYRRIVLFWWVLYLLMMSAERLFLLPDAWSSEPVDPAVTVSTLLTGLKADLIVASLIVLLALLSAVVVCGVGRRLAGRGGRGKAFCYTAVLQAASALLGLGLLAVLLADMGYYHHSRQHLDYVFIEYVTDLLAGQDGHGADQALRQTGAELRERTKWARRVGGFLLSQLAVGMLWWWTFRRSIDTAAGRLKTLAPGRPNLLLAAGLMLGISGLDLYGPLGVQRAAISSSTYYMLAQNPVWYAGEVVMDTLASRLAGTPSGLVHLMDRTDARALARQVLAPAARYPSDDYPFVKELPAGGVRPNRPPNILLIFVEGLDRRYVGRAIHVGDAEENTRHFVFQERTRISAPAVPGPRPAVALTPFLDSLRADSVTFDQFFTNGVQTARGLFASLCSFYPRHGTSVMRTRYTHDYLCLPSILKESGYRSEMVIGQNRDRNYDHIALFLARNGLDRFYDESDFPASAAKVGLGMTDGAVFDFLRTRIETLRATTHPYLLTTLTVTTHHPYAVPLEHPDVRALRWHEDGYAAALRYADLELERFLTGLRRDELLDNTIVLILGDHGRHEGIGRSDAERWAGHFLSPLFVWVDESLRARLSYRPRTVSAVASQVDLAPTLLALAGLTPPQAPFVGRDVSCALSGPCAEDHAAFLNSMYDDVIGLADRDGLWLYSLRTHIFYRSDLQLDRPTAHSVTDPEVQDHYRRMLALHVSSNLAIDENRVWSRTRFGGRP